MQHRKPSKAAEKLNAEKRQVANANLLEAVQEYEGKIASICRFVGDILHLERSIRQCPLMRERMTRLQSETVATAASAAAGWPSPPLLTG